MSEYGIKKVAIDGLAASGKSTVAKTLSEKLELSHLDTGAMYRAVAYGVISGEINPDNEPEVVKVARKSNIEIEAGRVALDGRDITTEIRGKDVTEIVSKIASYKNVRKQLRKKQLQWLDAHNGGVLEGRDIGTVILPNADLKVFVTASPEIRAERRAKESGRPFDEVLASIKARDKFDSNRKHAPLKKAKNSLEIDTSGKTVEEVVEKILTEVKQRYETKLVEMTDGIDPLKAQRHIGAAFISMLRCIAYPLFRAYFQVSVYNRKNIPKKGAVILAPAAHRSNLDTPMVGAMAGRRLRYMAKDSLFVKSRFWSRFLNLLGGFPVKRHRLDRGALDTAKKLLEKGSAIVVFPEGERKVGPRIFPLFSGVIWLSQHNSTPILPIGMAGGANAMPIGKKMFRPKKVVLYVGKLIHPPEERINRKELDQLTEQLRETLQELYDKAASLLK